MAADAGPKSQDDGRSIRTLGREPGARGDSPQGLVFELEKLPLNKCVARAIGFRKVMALLCQWAPLNSSNNKGGRVSLSIATGPVGM